QAPVLMVARQGAPRVRFAGPPRLLADLRVADRIGVRVEGSPEPLAARIEAIAPEIDSAARLVFAEASFEPGAAASRLRPGLVALVGAAVAPLSGYAEGPAIVVSQGARDVFAAAAGSVDGIAAQAGSWVKAGDPLVSLTRAAERGDLQQLEREWELQLLKVLRDPVDAPAREALATLQAQRERAT